DEPRASPSLAAHAAATGAMPAAHRASAPFLLSTLIALVALAAAATALWRLGDHTRSLGDELQELGEPIRAAADRGVDAVAGLIHRNEGAQPAAVGEPSAKVAAADSAPAPQPSSEPRVNTQTSRSPAVSLNPYANAPPAPI